MIPAYLVGSLLVLIAMSVATRQRLKGTTQIGKWQRRTLLTGLVNLSLLLIASAILPSAIPFFHLPEPSGPVAVGTRHYLFYDQNRPELFTHDPNDVRQVGAKVWYPAVPDASADQETYLPIQACRSLARFYGALYFQLDDYTIIPTNSVLEAAVDTRYSTYPVVIFSHAGGAGHMSQNVALMEDLASHGYIVFAVGHAYETPYLVKPTGEVVTFPATNEKRLQLVADANRDLSAYVTQILTFPNVTDQRHAWKNIVAATPHLAECENIRAADIYFLLRKLDSLNRSDDSLAGHMDMTRLGVIGHSGGGATAARVCMEDDRFKAGINMDGRQLSYQLDQRLRPPFMFMSSQWEDHVPSDFRIINEYYFARSAAPTYKLLIRGSKHANFSDFSLQGPLLRWAGVVGEIDGQRFTYIQNKYVLAFLDKYLKGANSPLLESSSPDFPEVELIARRNSNSAGT
jgi:hypothetical protein